MNSEFLIIKIEIDCPICDKIHLLDKKKRVTQGVVKGEIIEYEEVFYSCPVTNEEENEFVPATILDENLLRARNAYRKSKGLLSSYEIAEIRKLYELTQSEFSNLLGWGEITVTRYESKTIQDETYDNLMRMTRENPLFAMQSLERHKVKFSEEKFLKIRGKIVERVEQSGIQYLKMQEIISVYLNYDQESDSNGYKILDLEKLANVIGYFAQFVNKLYKVKLMKLLWYADVIHYKRHDKAMIGLVYKHMTYGALPLAYDEIIHLPTVKIEEEIIYDDISYRIVPSTEVNMSKFSLEELSILNLISSKFKDYGSREIVEYMHQEKAYKETEPFQIISYDLAKELNELG